MRSYFYALLHIVCFVFLLSGCAVFSGFEGHNERYNHALMNTSCDFNEDLQKISEKQDVIYVGLNAGMIARNCFDYKISNIFFDAAEKSFKYDVELQDIATKSTQFVGTTLMNDNLVDYEGYLYERIMLNAYKGLNYMALKDFTNARVEFNRALERQRRSKEYFAAYIQESKKSMDDFMKNSSDDFQKQTQQNIHRVQRQYQNMVAREFQAQAHFINPYATYLSAVFFWLDHDYIKASDLFKEITAIHPNNKVFKEQALVFDAYANTLQAKNLQKYVFVVYESGLGVVRDEFTMSLPFFVEKDDVIMVPFALATLKKRSDSYPYITINGYKTTELINMDDIVATEFNIELPYYVSKAVLSTVTKTMINARMAQSNVYMGFAADVMNMAITRADVRAWQALPKRISVSVLPNKGSVEIMDHEGKIVKKQKINAKKNTLVLVRSYSPTFPSAVFVVQEP